MMRKLTGHADSVCCIKFNKEKILFSSAEDGTLRYFDLRCDKGELLHQLSDGETAITCINFSSKAHHLIYVSFASCIGIIDRRMGCSNNFVATYEHNSDDINCIDLSKDGTLLAAADDLGEIAITDLRDGSLFKKLRKKHTNICSTIFFRSNSNWELVSGGLDNTVIKWNITRGNAIKQWAFGNETDGTSKIFNPPMVHCIAQGRSKYLRKFGNIVAAGRGDGIISLLNLEGNPQNFTKSIGPYGNICNFQSHSRAVNYVDFPDCYEGQKILSGGNDGVIRLQSWLSCTEDLPDAVSHEETCVFEKDHGLKINYLATNNSNADHVYVADVSNDISVYDTK